MNPELLLNNVHQLIAAVDFDRGRSYHICYFEETLQCLRSNHTGKPHPVFQTITIREITEGLTAGQWDRLLHKLTNFFREDTKCHEPPKHLLNPNP